MTQCDSIFKATKQAAIPVIMMCGIPGSGKSTKAAQVADSYYANIYSADAIREEMYGDANIQGDGYRVFETMYQRAIEDVKKGLPVVLDNTYISHKSRKQAMKHFKDYNVKFYCICLETDCSICTSRNENRDRTVPQEILESMAERYQRPSHSEGFEDIIYFE